MLEAAVFDKNYPYILLICMQSSYVSVLFIKFFFSQIAAIDCLKAALSIAPASTQLEVILSQECQTGN